MRTIATEYNIMYSILSNELKSKIRGLACYQIAGGVIGFGLTIWLIAQTETITGLVLLMFVFAVGLYSFSIYCGKQLLKSNIKRALTLSTLNQALQIVNFAVVGFAFKFVAGVILSIGFDYTNDFTFSFHFAISEFQFNINRDEELVTVGINLVAIYLIYFIDKLTQEIENEESAVEARQNPAPSLENSVLHQAE